MEALWIPTRANGRASFFHVFSFIRVCILLREARTRQLSEDGIRFPPPTDVTIVEGPMLNKQISPRNGRISSLKNRLVPSAIA